MCPKKKKVRHLHLQLEKLPESQSSGAYPYLHKHTRHADVTDRDTESFPLLDLGLIRNKSIQSLGGRQRHHLHQLTL